MERFDQSLKILEDKAKNFRGTQNNSCGVFNQINADFKKQLEVYHDLLTVENDDLKKSLLYLKPKVEFIRQKLNTKGKTSARTARKQLTNWEDQNYCIFREEISNLTEGRDGFNYQRLKEVFQNQLQLYQDLKINGGVEIGNKNYKPPILNIMPSPFAHSKFV